MKELGLPFDEPLIKPALTGDIFGCCSHYRECSAARRCVSSIKGYSENCQYNKNLKQGRIFYGPNAPDFSQKDFRRVRAIYKNLSSGARKEFDEYLWHFFRTKVLASFVECYRTPYLTELVKTDLVFDAAVFGFGYFVQRLKAHVLKQIYPRWQIAFNEMKEHNQNFPQHKKTFKDCIIEYATREAKDFPEARVLRRYALVKLNPEWHRYFIEIAEEIFNRSHFPNAIKTPTEFIKSRSKLGGGP